MQVVTHSGGFHADDVFAIAALELALGAFGLVRTRDDARVAAADVRVDVGGRSDPATGDFDHHQRGGAGERSNGVRFASFGLVWRHFGERIAGSAAAAAAIDERLVQGVDANDTGQELTRSAFDGARPMTVSGVVAAMNPAWDEDLGPAEEDARFAEAVAFARGVLEREVAGAAAYARAQALVQAAIERAHDPRVVELDRNMPWREAVVAGAPDALFVVYPKADGWALAAVPQQAGAFANRLDLPAEWAGLSGAGLAELTGVPDAVFCHSARFYATAGTREGVLALAGLALAAGAQDPAGGRAAA